MKKCTECGEEKLLTEFNRQSRAKNGRRAQCRICQAVYNREYDKKNHDLVLQKAREQYANNKEQHAAQAKEYARTHKEQIQAYRKQWLEANRERTREYSRKWRKANPQCFRDANRRKRARLKQVYVEYYDSRDIYERDGWICQLCGEPVDPNAPESCDQRTIDHVVPLSRGGADAPDNVQLAHRSCNSRKLDKIAV